MQLLLLALLLLAVLVHLEGAEQIVLLPLPVCADLLGICLEQVDCLAVLLTTIDKKTLGCLEGS